MKMVIRIFIASVLWGLIYEFIIPLIYAVVVSIPLIGTSIIADGIITMICFIIAVGVSFICKTSFERYILLALGILYLAMLGIIIPLASGQSPYFTWEFGNIVFGSIVGWYVSAKTAEDEKHES